MYKIFIVPTIRTVISATVICTHLSSWDFTGYSTEA